MMDHETYMRRALELARRGEGRTRPNPPVGAVLVRNGRIVAEGWHARAGGPHAEVVALRAAGQAARGADLYVTLEPCSTFGRTPPCVEAIRAAGVRRVYAAMRDPNPLHAGRGLRSLRRAGIACEVGLGGEEASALIEPFGKWIRTGKPYLTLKLGLTLDGRIADATGRSRWITGPAARKQVQAMRRTADAILVGGETLRQDDPVLLPRPASGRRPWRIILSRRGPDRLDYQVFAGPRAAQTILVTSPAVAARIGRTLEKRGVQVWPLRGRSLAPLLARLGDLGVLHVLCEGGGRLGTGLLREKLVDRLVLMMAPQVLGGDARPALAGCGWRLGANPKFRLTRMERLGPDCLLVAEPSATREE